MALTSTSTSTLKLMPSVDVDTNTDANAASTQGLSERRLHSAGELERLMQSAEGHRRVAATAMNAESSRSHTVRHTLTELACGTCYRSAPSALGAL